MFHLGLSGKSVLLYALVFTCRYLDLFVHFISPYNTIMKVIYIVATYLTLYFIYRKFRLTYDRNHDAFRIELLIIPAAALSFIWNHELTPLEVNQTIVVEPVISMFSRSRFCGPSLFISSRSPFCLSCTWSVEQAKQRRLPVTTFSHWVSIDFSTSSIGFIVITRRTSSIGSRLLRALCKRCSTVISSISTSRKVRKCRQETERNICFVSLLSPSDTWQRTTSTPECLKPMSNC